MFVQNTASACIAMLRCMAQLSDVEQPRKSDIFTVSTRRYGTVLHSRMNEYNHRTIETLTTGYFQTEKLHTYDTSSIQVREWPSSICPAIRDMLVG